MPEDKSGPKLRLTLDPADVSERREPPKALYRAVKLMYDTTVYFNLSAVRTPVGWRVWADDDPLVALEISYAYCHRFCDDLEDE